MKAYKSFNDFTGYGAVVFAVSPGLAKQALLSSDEFDGFEYTEIRVRRAPEFDKEYRGHCFMEWDDDLDLLALVKNGWYCHEELFDPYDCERCVAQCYCDKYSDYLREANE